VPKPADTPPPAAKSDTVYVGNTDGEGVYVRKTPVMADRVRAYPDGTQLTIIGDEVDGDGQHWQHVRTPDGLEGYVPSIYTVAAPP
jgi:Bacterial SH3 domain